MMRESTLCLPIRQHPAQEILLGFKKAGFGAGKITGFGGKVEPGETVAQAAVRELAEETGMLTSEDALRSAGRLTFVFPARPQWSQVVHAFLVTAWNGEPAESVEMVPRWFALDAVPYDKMWQDGTHWLPPILAGKQVRARFTFGDDNESIRDLEIDTWDRGSQAPRSTPPDQEGSE